MGIVVVTSLSALLFPVMAQRGRRTHTYARFLLGSCSDSWFEDRGIYMCGVLVSQRFVSFHGLKNEAYYTLVLSVSLFRVLHACFAGLSSRFMALAWLFRLVTLRVPVSN